MLAHTVLEGFITEWQSHTYYIDSSNDELITIKMAQGHLTKITVEGLEDK